MWNEATQDGFFVLVFKSWYYRHIGKREIRGEATKQVFFVLAFNNRCIIRTLQTMRQGHADAGDSGCWISRRRFRSLTHGVI